MAKVKLVAPYEDFRGRDSAKFTPNGSVVYPRNGAPMTRSFNRPKQPNNALQYEQRFFFLNAARAWSLLSDADQASWNDLGQTFTRTTTTGFVYHPSGRSLFIENVMLAGRNGLSAFLTAPATVTWPAFFPISNWQTDESGTDAIFTFAGVPTEATVALYFCGPLSPGVRSLRGRNWVNPTWPAFSLEWTAGAVYPTVALSSSIHVDEDSLRIVPQEGLRYGMRLQVVDPLCNLLGPTYDAIVVPFSP